MRTSWTKILIVFCFIWKSSYTFVGVKWTLKNDSKTVNRDDIDVLCSDKEVEDPARWRATPHTKWRHPQVNLKPTVHKAEMALAATLLPSGRVRSVMARTTLGFARAGSFTSSETWVRRNKKKSGSVPVTLSEKTAQDWSDLPFLGLCMEKWFNY